MGNYLYDSYEARMKVTNDYINDWNFYTKLKENFISPKKVAIFVQIIFVTFKCPPYHTKFLQIFYNNLFILETYFEIVEELFDDLVKNKLSFPESFHNFNGKLHKIKNDNKIDISKFNHGLVKPKNEALKYFFTYVNFHKSQFDKIKEEIQKINEEVSKFPQMIDNETIKKIEKNNDKGTLIYIGQMSNDLAEGKGILTMKNNSDEFVYMGEFQNDKLNGYGIFKKNDMQIEGIFKDGNMNGLMCIYYADRKEFSEYSNDLRNGRSITFNKNGNILTFVYENDIQKETMSVYLKSSDKLFTGKKINNNLYEGIIYSKEDGSVDVGNFNKNFSLQGIGYAYDRFNGYYAEFNEGKIKPSIGCVCRDNGKIYIGNLNEEGFLNDENGLQLYYTNDNYKSDLYFGSFVDGERKGYGEYYWAHGDYEKAFNPEIWGVRYFINHEVYVEGKLVGGFPEGPGFLQYKDEKYRGIYDLNDNRCLFLEENGKAYRINIVNDARINIAEAEQHNVIQN